MPKCRTHNMDYEDFCVFCEKEHEHHISKKIKESFELMVYVGIIIIIFILSLRYFI